MCGYAARLVDVPKYVELGSGMLSEYSFCVYWMSAGDTWSVLSAADRLYPPLPLPGVRVGCLAARQTYSYFDVFIAWFVDWLGMCPEETIFTAPRTTVDTRLEQHICDLMRSRQQPNRTCRGRQPVGRTCSSDHVAVTTISLQS